MIEVDGSVQTCVKVLTDFVGLFLELASVHLENLSDLLLLNELS